MYYLREVGPSRKILHARGVGSERRKRVAGRDGSWGTLGATRKIKILSLISYFGRSRDHLFWHAVCDLSRISFIFMVSEVPSSDFDSLRVRILERFLAKISRLSFPCFPVKVFAFFVFTNNPLINFLWELLFQEIDSETMLFVVFTDA